VETVRSYLAADAAAALKKMPPETSRAIAEELKSIPVLEGTSTGSTMRIPGLDRPDYRALTLPSGYVVIYRRLSEQEVKEMGDTPLDENYLVANLVRVVDLPAATLA